MIKYFKIKYDESNNTQECFWCLELDTEKEEVLREIEFDEKMNIVRKAPSKEDGHGCFTDNLNVIVKGQEPKYKETIIIDPADENTEEIKKEEFEKYWLMEYEYKKKKTPRVIKYVLLLFLILLLYLIIK